MSSTVTRILFVCHGNICRSPTAEFIFRDMLLRRGLAGLFTVASAATSTDDLGSPVYPPARAELARHGLGCEGKRAVLLQASDYDRYDLIIGMDDANIRDMTAILGGDPGDKLRKLMDYTGRGGNVTDPWYSGLFETAYNDIHEGCESLLTALGY